MTSDNIFPLSILLGILIVLSGFFSSSEIGMMAINRYRLRHLVREGNRFAKIVEKLLSRPDRILGVILIGNTFANILASAIATTIAVALWGDLGILIGTIALTLVILIFAEVAPKTVAASYPQKIAFFAALPLALLLKILYPLVWLTNAIANGLLFCLRITIKHGRKENLSGEELRTVVHEAGGLIPRSHKEMLLSVFDLERVTVNDIMVPRNEIIGIDLYDDWDDIVDQLQNSAHTRLLLFKGEIEKAEGLLHIRSALSLFTHDKASKETLSHAATPIYFVPEFTPLSTQLMNFRQRKERSAIVVNEYGDIEGLVTLEDILEEIVGEFTTDVQETLHKEVHPQNDGSYLIDGGAVVRELNRDFNWELPTDGPKTLNGLIIEALEQIPQTATSVMIAGYPIEIVQVKDNAVKTARIQPELRVVEEDDESENN